MKNKKGFTLVELLAVIVILALIMSIAVISIGGVLDTAKDKTYKETAASIIDGVKKQLLIANSLNEGYYGVNTSILDKGGKDSPWGGSLTISSSFPTGCTAVTGTTGVCKYSSTQTCSSSSSTYVHFNGSGDGDICLTAGSGNKYVEGTESQLLDQSNNTTVKPASGS